MEDELQCPVCSRLYDNPVILPCSHTVCYNCAEALIAKNGNPNVSTPASAYSLHQLNRKSLDADKMSLQSDAVLSDSDSGYSGASANGIANGNEGNASPVMASSLPGLPTSYQPHCNPISPQASPNNGINLPILPQSVKCLTCPICHRTLFLDERGTEGLNKNALMQTIADRYAKSNANKCPNMSASKSNVNLNGINQALTTQACMTSNHVIPVLSHNGGLNNMELCQICEKSPANEAVIKCLQCKVCYCGNCRENCHPSRGPLAQHTLVHLKRTHLLPNQETDKPHIYRMNKFQPLPNKPLPKNGLKLASCSQHSSEKTSLYCETCRVSLCVLCQDEGRHKTHSMKPIGALFRLQKSDLSGQMSALSNKARQAKDLVMLLRGTQDQIEKSSLDLEAKTVTQCNNLIEAVERKRDELLQKIVREKEVKCKTVRDQLQQCTMKLKQTTGLLEYCIEVVKDNDVAAFLQISQSLSERVSTMEKQWSPRTLQPRVNCQFDLELPSSSLALAVDKLDFIQTEVPDKPVMKVEHNAANKANTVTLTWIMAPKSQSADGYRLEMDNGCNGPFKEVYCGTETLCTVDGLHLNSVYKARIRAFNGAGHGPFSDLLHLQTSEATDFQMNDQQLHPDIHLSGDNGIITCKNCEHRVVVGNVGFSRGIHYWEFTIDRCLKRPGPAFGVALINVDNSKMLGKGEGGWSLYGPDGEQSWLLHDGQHLKRCDFALKQGSKVGLLLDLNRKCVSYYIDDQLLNTPLVLNPKDSESEVQIYYPAISLNDSAQVTLHTGVRAPLAAKFHRNRCQGTSGGENVIHSPLFKSFSTPGEPRTPRTPPPPPIRRSSSGSLRSDGESVSTNGSDPPRRSFSSFFQRKSQNQSNDQRLTT